MPMLPKLEGMRQLGEEQGAERAETKEAKELRQSLDELRAQFQASISEIASLRADMLEVQNVLGLTKEHKVQAERAAKLEQRRKKMRGAVRTMYIFGEGGGGAGRKQGRGGKQGTNAKDERGSPVQGRPMYTFCVFVRERCRCHGKPASFALLTQASVYKLGLLCMTKFMLL
eukprot:Tamp_08235.p1 GENE.Tamp_08235~~Tamp_08235.p1  ORF type:complete len:172 (+),score=21.47 Tamp_08235:99-614(+)